MVGDANRIWVVEDGPGFLKPHAVDAVVRLRLGRVPLERHVSLYVQTYGKARGWTQLDSESRRPLSPFSCVQFVSLCPGLCEPPSIAGSALLQ